MKTKLTKSLNFYGIVLLAFGLVVAVPSLRAGPATFPMQPGEVVVTGFSGSNPDGFNVTVIDTRPPLGPFGANWLAPMFHNEFPVTANTWKGANMGEVFGVCLDNQSPPNIYVTATVLYGAAPQPFGPAGSGGVYKLDGNTGAISTFASLPTGPASLGNICFDAAHNQFFVSHLDNGLIYRLDINGVQQPSPYDHGVSGRPNQSLVGLPDDGNPGLTAAGRRVWGVQVYNGRLYYSVWNGDTSTSGGVLINEIWSVGLNANGSLNLGSISNGGPRREISLPSLPNNTFRSSPVSDISFSNAGKMLLAERSAVPSGTTYSSSYHTSRVLEYVQFGSVWTSSRQYFVGNYSFGYPAGYNSAGGADYDCNEQVFATGDALIHNGTEIYGLQIIPPGGNTSSAVIDNSYLIDLDGDTTIVDSADKTRIGDVAVLRENCGCATISCPQNKVVSCDSAWDFDAPVSSGCTNYTINSTSTVTTGTCPVEITRTWVISDASGNKTTCSQTVTVAPQLTFFSGTRNSSFVSTYNSPYGNGHITVSLAAGSGLSSAQNDTPLWSSEFTELFPNANNNWANNVQAIRAIGAGNFTISVDLTQYHNLSPGFVFGFYNIRDEGTYSMAAFDSSNVQISPPFTWHLIGNDDDLLNPMAATHIALDATTGTFSTQTYQFGVQSDAAFWNQIPSNTAKIVITAALQQIQNNADGVVLYFAESPQPTVSCPSDKSVACGTPWDFDLPVIQGGCGANATIEVTGTTTNATAISSQKIVTRTWRVTDACGNSTNCSQNVIVNSTHPVIQCPANIVVQSCTNLAISYAVTATSLCCSNVSVVLTPPSGSTFQAGTTNVVHAVATDSCGNTSTCDFTVTVACPINPSISLDCSTNKTVLCGTAWNFDPPTVPASFGTNYTLSVLSTVTNAGAAGTTITRTWQVSGGCISTGTNSWSPLGDGVDGEVWALAEMGGNLYAGGWFTHAGGLSANHVAKWDGSNWSPLGSGTNNGINGGVFALASIGGKLFATGYFTSAGGAPATNIAQWDGTSWSPLGSGLVGFAAVEALAVKGTDLYAGGFFTTAGGVTANHVAKWDSLTSTWSPVGTGVATGDRVNSMAFIGNDLYAGGQITTAGGLSVNNIAKWDGSAWSALGTGLNLSAGGSLGVLGGNLYAGGVFTTAGGNSANRVAKWNPSTSTWSSLGSGMNDGVEGFAVLGTDLIASGGFMTAGGVSAFRVARWNGSNWSPLGTGMNDGVWRLAVIGNDLYAGGIFTTAGGLSANHVAKWGASCVPATAICSQTVTVLNSLPVIVCPTNITVTTTGANAVVIYSNPTVTGGVLASTIPASGSLFPLGTTVVTCTATNACGTSTCTFQVNVTAGDCLTGTVLLNTGYNHINGAPYPIGVADAFWTVVADPDTGTTEPRPASTITNHPAWSHAQTNSQWISSYSSFTDVNNGDYDFETRFCLQKGWSNIVINLCILADDGADVYVNGSASVLTTPNPDYTTPYCGTINNQALFVTGSNVLRVRVHNTGNVAMGLNLTGSITGTGLLLNKPECCQTGSSISGQKFNDLNGNGVRDAGEPALQGWTIKLSPGNLSAVTDSQGYYYFLGLSPNTYTVSEVQQPCWTQTAPNNGVYSVTLGLAQSVNNKDFGNQRCQLLCSTNKTVNCGTAWGFDTPTDSCGGKGLTIAVLSTMTNGTSPQMITRQWRIVDACGSTNTCSQTVTVLNSLPVIVCPADIAVTTTGANAVVTYSSPVVTGGALASSIPASGSLFPLGTTVVTCTATNACGASTCTFQVNVTANDCQTGTVLLNTGYDHTSGAPYPIGVTDAFWTVVADPDSGTTEPRPASTITNHPAWSHAQTNSQWISSYSSFTDVNNGDYDFETRFCLQKGWSNVVINLCILADDAADVFVNGSASVLTTPNPDFANVYCGSINNQALFVTGSNILKVRVHNTGNVAMGLNLTGSITGAGLSLNKPECCQPGSSISGQKFNDLNGNGVRDAGEPALPGWTIQLSPGNLSAVTDSQGYYYFLGLTNGTYTVSEVQQSCWTQTAPSNGVYAVTLGLAQSVNNKDFGNQRCQIQCPTNKTVNCGTAWGFDAPTDNCGGKGLTIAVLSTMTNGICPQVITRQWQVIDACGSTNKCSQTVTVVDTTPPIILCSTNKEVECSMPWTFDPPIALDGCSGTNVTITVVGTVTNGTCPQVITRTWEVKDLCNNKATCSQTVTVVDTMPPLLVCAGNKIVGCGETWSFDPPAALDGFSGTNVVLTVVSTITNGISPVVITRTWKATDTCGNSATCSQTVTLTGSPTPVNCTNSAVTIFSIGTIDEFKGAEPAYPSAGLLARLQAAGIHSFKGFDDCATDSFFAHTFTNLPSCIVGATLEIRLKACDSAENDTVGLNFTGPSGTIVSPGWGRYLGNGNSGGAGLFNTTWTTGAAGQIVLDLSALPNASGTTTDLIPALNINGFLDLTLQDDSAIDYAILTVTSCCCMKDIVLNTAPGQCCAVATFTPPVFAGGCSSVTTVCTPPSGTCFPVGTNLVECKATDALGQVGRCFFKVIVRDTVKPTILSCPTNIVVIAGSKPDSGILLDLTDLVIATDNCTPVNQLTITQNPPPGTTVSGGSVTFTVTDAAGNFTQCTETVVVHPNCAPPPEGLGLWLTFDESSGLTAYNSTAGGNNGVLNGPTRNSTGYVNSSLCFDGVNDSVQVPSYPGVNPGTGDLTLDAWIKRDLSGQAQTRIIVDKRNPSTIIGYSLAVDSGKLLFQMGSPANNFSNYPDTQALPADSEWHFVAVTVQRGALNGGRFYIDGNPTGTFNPTGHPGSLDNTNAFVVGNTPVFAASPWLGCIDEVEVFRRSLKPAEISAIYNARFEGKCRPTCLVPQLTTTCKNETSIQINAKICNSASVSQTYSYSFQGLGIGPGHNWPGPSTFTPSSGTTTVGPNACVTVPVTIQMPAGMPCGNTTGYQMTVVPVGTSDFVTSQGLLYKSCSLCAKLPPNPTGTLSVLTATAVVVPIENISSNKLDLTGARFKVFGPDRMPDTDYVSLNGLPPGMPWEVPSGKMLLPGETTELSVEVQLANYSPGTTFTLLLEADVDGDGEMEPIASIALSEDTAQSGTVLSVSQAVNGNLMLEWPAEGGWVLQQSSSILGPWTDVTGAASPYKEIPSQQGTGKFYRLIQRP